MTALTGALQSLKEKSSFDMARKTVVAVITFDDTLNDIQCLADAATWIDCALSSSTRMDCDVTTYSTAADATHHIFDGEPAIPVPLNAPNEQDNTAGTPSVLEAPTASETPATDIDPQFVALVGNISEGFNAHGPFPDLKAADAYTSKGLNNAPWAPCWIMQLTPPA